MEAQAGNPVCAPLPLPQISQGLLNSMGAFVRASFREDGLRLASQGGLDSSASSWGEDLEMLQEQGGGTMPPQPVRHVYSPPGHHSHPC